MNRNQHNSQGDSRGYQTHRSERYRYPEGDNNYRFDDYGSAARGGYGNEGHTGTWGNQGNEMAGSRNTSNQDTYGTYSTSRNYGNMGSYGGAQGFGTSRGGNIAQRHYGSDDTNYNFESGMGNPREARNSGYSPGGHRAYGYQSDYDSHSSDRDRFSNDRNRGFLSQDQRGERGHNRYTSSSSGNDDLYGSDTSRRFEGSKQSRYDFDRDDYNSGSGSFRGNSSRSVSNYEGSKRGSFGSDRYNSANFGGSDDSYMGSGYDRDDRNESGSGRRSYGSYGYGSFGGGYSNDQPQPYDLGDRGSSNSDSNYFKSGNRGRTIDRDRGDDRDRSYGGRY